MRVHTCYTKPSPTSPDHLRYNLIQNGCEVDTNTHMISQSTHETRFLFKDFEYTSDHQGIHVMCDATFCSTSDYSRQCTQTCNPTIRRNVNVKPVDDVTQSSFDVTAEVIGRIQKSVTDRLTDRLTDAQSANHKSPPVKTGVRLPELHCGVLRQEPSYLRTATTASWPLQRLLRMARPMAKCPRDIIVNKGLRTTPCPRGTYNSEEGKQSLMDCVDCPAGQYCYTSDGTTGNICPIGSHCPVGSPSPVMCLPGTYTNVTGQAACAVCPAGFQCVGGSSVVPCSQGQYCPQGTGLTTQPCPIGTYGHSEGLANSTECTPCSTGTYCDTTGLTQPAGNCSAGYFCTIGVSLSVPVVSTGLHTGTGDICPPGAECPYSSGYFSFCKPGTYSPARGSQTCLPCPPGSYCVNATINPVVCPTGHYCPQGTTMALEFPCPMGTYNNVTGSTNETACIDCPPGYYCEGTGNTVPDGQCDEGFWCAGAAFSARPYDSGNLASSGGGASGLYSNDTCAPTWDCVCPDFLMSTGGICPMGYYCPQGSSKPIACDKGMYCETPGLPLPTGNCSAGYYCNNASATPTQHPCPVGHYCLVGLQPIRCPAGTFSNQQYNEELLDCNNCTAGYYCNGTGLTAESGLCAPGYYCPGGQSSITPLGLECWPGHYCEEGVTIPVFCPNGTYQPNSGQSVCEICDPGFYCNLASGGQTTCNGLAITTPANCTMGHYCPLGSSLPTPCAVGTYGDALNYQAQANCRDCTPGMYCGTAGQIAPTANCSAGYYCTGAAEEASPVNHKVDPNDNTSFTGNDICPVGYFCPEGSDYPEPCPIGTFSRSTGVTQVEDCLPCLPGHYCFVQANIKNSTMPACDPGYVCLEGSSTPNPTDGVTGYICPRGHFCEAGTTQEEACPPGTYQASLGQDNCTVCPAGYMCLYSNMTVPERCMTGHYCVFGDPNPVPCPPGTFNNDTGQDQASDCTDCSVGMYCEGTGNTLPDGDCEAGYFCQGGANQSTPVPSGSFPLNGPCPTGHFCPNGTKLWEKCPAGTFRPVTTGKTVDDCQACTGGMYCAIDGLSAPTGNCSKGYYCPTNETTNSSTPTGFECPVGYYCLEGSAAPTPCPAGFFSTTIGRWECQPCTMVPNICPNGTYTYDNTTGLQQASECLPCETSVYCRSGQLSSECVAGYFCLSGSKSDMPPTTTNFSGCEPYDECAGPCPTGHYCLEGTYIPTPCPETVYRPIVGAAQLEDCDLCPAGYMCDNGTTNPVPCIAGHYCLNGTGISVSEPIPCPVNFYLDTTGNDVLADCKPCISGYICNQTGMTDYSLYPCPSGFYCRNGEDPELCPAGRMRNTSGAGEPEDCPLCRAGYYCPNDTINLHGIPCRPGYYCPTGSPIELLCPPGMYCEGVTGDPPLCPPGYYCPGGTIEPILCEKPFYCPLNSSYPSVCDLGYQALDHAGLRYDSTLSCRICPAGTYGNYTDRSICEACPGGYYCPAGTGHGDSNICRMGSYCPVGSHYEKSCPRGTYGTFTRAEAVSDCTLCPANAYSNLDYATRCETCGKTSTSPEGSTACSCKGKYRTFQESFKACVCLAGYVYYDDLDLEKSELDGDEDCQLISDDRCSTHQVRDSSTRKCVDPDTVSCEGWGGCASAYYSTDQGRCFCDSYVSETSICPPSCEATTKPQMEGSLLANGTLAITIIDPVTKIQTITAMPDCLGPGEGFEGQISKTILVVAMWGDQVTGAIYTNADSAHDAFKSLEELSQEAAAVLSGRRRLLALTVPTTHIPNPVLCVESGEMVIFKININHTDRAQSHYPKYNKDHLFSTNPTFDFGAFTSLKYQVENTNANISNFAHVFNEGGNYVFYDAADPTLEVLIRVEPEGVECSSSARIKPASPDNIIALGFATQNVENQAPDWSLIAGIIAFFATLCLLLVLAIFIWLPKHAGLHPMLHWAPKYRSLGKPPPVPHYMRYDPDHWPEKPIESDVKVSLGPRVTGDGADADLLAASTRDGGVLASEKDLEDFNVRVLYDKLEDQNLHLAAQLARQQEDLRNFYKKIQQQNEGLRDLLMNMDPEKLQQLEMRLNERKAARIRDGLQGASGDMGPNIVNATIGIAGSKHKFAGAGAGGREADLMLALQLLLDRLNTGQIPISQTIYEQLRKDGGVEGGATTSSSSDTTNINFTGPMGGSQMSRAVAELLRRQNGERLRLERELLKEEQTALGQDVEEEENRRRHVRDGLTDGLVTDLHGADSAAQIAEIMSRYGKNLDDTMNKHQTSRDRQSEELRRKLAMRRQTREQALRQKQSKEAQEAGLPAIPEPADVSDMKLRMSESVLDTLAAEETSGQAKLEAELAGDLGEEERRQMCEKMKDHLGRMAEHGVVSVELRDQLLQQHKSAEEALQKTHKARKQSQLQNLHEKMAQRRKRRFEKLRDEQERYKNEMSTRLIEEGHTEDLERELAALQRLFDQQMAAAEAEMDAEQNEHINKLTKTLSNEHTTGLREKQRALLKLASDNCPPSEQVSMQRLMDQYRKEQEGIEQGISLEKDRQLEDLRAKLQARRNRRMNEATRKMEEDEAQRVVAEQRKQMQQEVEKEAEVNVAVDTSLIKQPKVNIAESIEEKALKKDQERGKEDLRKQQKKEFDSVASKLDSEAQKQEEAMKGQLNSEREKVLRELKNKHAAEIAARPDLSQDQINLLMGQHEKEIEDLADRLENEKNRQMLALRERLANRRMRKLDDLRRRQDVERTKEMLEQKKELDEVRLKKAREAEREAIIEGIKDNGEEDGERVIKAVLAQRHAQEMADLDKQFAAEKRMMVDDALNKLNEKYDKLRDQMMKRHDQELADLLKQGLSPDELAAKRAELLNQQAQELSTLDRQQAEEKGDIERGALADWELRFAKAKLAAKEKHYKEFAEALREFKGDKAGAQAAEEMAAELDEVRRRLEQERLDYEARMKKEQQDFEKEEQKRMEDQMAEFARQLESETRQEKEKHEKNLESLAKRKDDLIKTRREKMKEEVERIRAQGASAQDQQDLLAQHERDLQSLVNKIDADKMRMQSTLQERLKKKKEDRLKSKQKELFENAEENRREMEHKHSSQIQRMKADEALTLNEALNIDTATARMESRDSSRRPGSSASSRGTTGEQESPAPRQELPPMYKEAAPINDAELVALLMASPLYQKLESIKTQIEKGAHLTGKGDKSEGQVFQDSKDIEWTSDSKLEPVDLNKLDARKFIVYKFGVFVTELVATHCQHAPVTLLLADKIPPNERLRNNAYRNSFYFDANNSILYLRSARLDTVGEFVVVLVHTLAHIKS
ncbi:hypothetical protein DPMN_048189, partial [Dreissena polymorpha]